MSNLLSDIYSEKRCGRFLRWFRSVERTSKFVLKFFEEKNMKGKFLDIGAWDASLGKFLPKEVEYYPLDVIPIDHPNAVICDLNNKKIQFPNKYFDYIIADQVLEHLFYPFEVCKEIHRVLKDKGIAMIGLPNDLGLMARIDFFLKKRYDTIKNQEFQHHWNFTFENSKKFLGDCGFKIVKYAGRFGITHPLIVTIAPITFYKVVKKRR